MFLLGMQYTVIISITVMEQGCQRRLGLKAWRLLLAKKWVRQATPQVRWPRGGQLSICQPGGGGLRSLSGCSRFAEGVLSTIVLKLSICQAGGGTA